MPEKRTSPRPRIAVTCDWCGAVKLRAPWAVGPKHNFCGVACFSESRRNRPLAARLDRRAAMRGTCRVWTGERTRGGYGVVIVSTRPKRVRPAHRLAWELAHGPIPDGMNVLHRCDVRQCILPDHLFLGTDADNRDDCVAKGHHARGERQGMAKLTEPEVLDIRRLVAEGVWRRQIAARFGISHVTVRSIAQRKTWKHI